ncbi:hypothetical protein TNCV_3607041, partial [Trichonephila clavipes]
LAIPFVPNRDPPDTPQQSQLGEVVHYPSIRMKSLLIAAAYMGGHMDQGSHPDI